jgi:hypothetical protein
MATPPNNREKKAAAGNDLGVIFLFYMQLFGKQINFGKT